MWLGWEDYCAGFEWKLSKCVAQAPPASSPLLKKWDWNVIRFTLMREDWENASHEKELCGQSRSHTINKIKSLYISVEKASTQEKLCLSSPSSSQLSSQPIKLLCTHSCATSPRRWMCTWLLGNRGGRVKAAPGLKWTRLRVLWFQF